MNLDFKKDDDREVDEAYEYYKKLSELSDSDDDASKLAINYLTDNYLFSNYLQNKKSKKMEIQTNEIKATETKKKPKITPLKHSNFFFTINTQKNLNTMNSEESNSLNNKFREVMKEFFYVKLKDFVVMSGSKQAEGFGLPRNATREDLEKRIEKANCEYVIEVGPQSGKLHCHGMLCFAKRGVDTKLDYDKIRTFLEEKLGFICHLQVQLFRDSKKNLQDYISKKPFN